MRGIASAAIAAVCILGALLPSVAAQAPLRAPVIVWPAGNATAPVNLTDGFLPLEWRKVDNATSYGLTIADTDNGSPLDRFPQTCALGPQRTTFDPTSGSNPGICSWHLSGGTTYRWTIRAMENLTPGDEAAGYFRTLGPGAPALLSPRDASNFTPTFRWTAVPGADGYSLVIRDRTAGLDITRAEGEYVGNVTSYRLPDERLRLGDLYSWSVIAYDGRGIGVLGVRDHGGLFGPQSEIVGFHVQTWEENAAVTASLVVVGVLCAVLTVALNVAALARRLEDRPRLRESVQLYDTLFTGALLTVFFLLTQFDVTRSWAWIGYGLVALFAGFAAVGALLTAACLPSWLRDPSERDDAP